MKVRIGYSPGLAAGEPPDRASFLALVDALDATGFDSLWLPELYLGSSLDPLGALSFAAGRVSRLKLGTQLIVPGRNVFRAARAVASLDRLSAGRLLLTVVPGLDTPEELQAAGIGRTGRSADLERRLADLRTLWAGGAVGGLRIDVRPAQDPLEVWLGGSGPKGLARAGRLGDGWIGGFTSVAESTAGRLAVEDAATAAGRVISPEHFGANLLYAHAPLPDDVAARLGPRAPTVCIGWDAVRERLAAHLAGGISKFVIRPAVSPRNDPGAWRTEIDAAAAGVLDLQTR